MLAYWRTGTILALVLVLAACAPRPHRLMFVLPQQLPNGESSAAQRGDLELWMVRQAGGFTRIDSVEGGWMTQDGQLLRESNVLYLLTLPPEVPSSFASELEGRILTDFDQQEVWMQRW